MTGWRGRGGGASIWAGLVVLVLLAGCSPISTASTLGGAVLEDRSGGDQVEDLRIRVALNKALLDDSARLFRAVSTKVWEGRVMLTGAVAEAAQMDRAVAAAWGIDGVDEVINELQVAEAGSLGDFVDDGLITQKLEARLLADGEVRSVNYRMSAVKGTVYLLGVARGQGELDRVMAHARDIDGVRRVVPHVRLLNADA
ncbi:BON domain-containing protein [Roseospirillum parvum]|uniref:Osmotically-inducible protein OsmY, contains BON domain n=1 Tax=Roseospirillum parvum TaxID=83401 RepID=A0A1G8ES39_9PROT|nr:BON domain-containing protein [Roseospirillum parvum]SDH72722.1 Osmotically-inducible protein OsmY, contains BON domain [Roseospirillum parvum]